MPDVEFHGKARSQFDERGAKIQSSFSGIDSLTKLMNSWNIYNLFCEIFKFANLWSYKSFTELLPRLLVKINICELNIFRIKILLKLKNFQTIYNEKMCDIYIFIALAHSQKYILFILIFSQ